MKIPCYLTMRPHKWHKMPWLYERKQAGKWYQMPGPEKACLRCGALKYAYSIYIPSPEAGPLGWEKWEYEGQWLREYDSYEDYVNKRWQAIETLTDGKVKRPKAAIFTNEW